MIFDKHESLCKPNAKKIVSRDKGTLRSAEPGVKNFGPEVRKTDSVYIDVL